MTSSAQNFDCARVTAQIQAYVDGELPAVACSPIEAHCETCPGCAALVRELRHTIGVCRDAGRAPLPESVRTRAREQVRRLLALHPASRSTPARRTRKSRP